MDLVLKLEKNCMLNLFKNILPSILGLYSLKIDKYLDQE